MNGPLNVNIDGSADVICERTPQKYFDPTLLVAAETSFTILTPRLVLRCWCLQTGFVRLTCSISVINGDSCFSTDQIRYILKYLSWTSAASHACTSDASQDFRLQKSTRIFFNKELVCLGFNATIFFWMQWRIQDFREGAPTAEDCDNLLFCKLISQKLQGKKIIWTERMAHMPPHPTPQVSHWNATPIWKPTSHLRFQFQLSEVFLSRTDILLHIFIKARKHSLRRLCFYTCLSVILFTGGCFLPRLGASSQGDASSQGGASSRGVLPPGGVLPHRGASSQGGCFLRGGPVETPRDGYCCGRYASYWNAFLWHKSSTNWIFDTRHFGRF